MIRRRGTDHLETVFGGVCPLTYEVNQAQESARVIKEGLK